MRTICLIDVYFGKLPMWINLFLETCKGNPTVNWVIFIDDEVPKNKANNVKFIKSSLAEMNKFMSKRLNLKITVKNPYKYCDIRPAYGHIFKDVLKNYAFWGHTDLDVLFGDIRGYMTDKLLDGFDIISADQNKICGPFTIFRNVPKVNELYLRQKKPSYKEIFENTDKHYHNNEQGMTDVVNEAYTENIINKRFTQIHKFEKGNYTWKNGEIIDNGSGESIMYVHLRRFKDGLRITPQIDSFTLNEDVFTGDNEWVEELNNGK